MKKIKKSDLIGYLYVLDYKPAFDGFSAQDLREGKESLCGCLSRILNELDEFAFQEKYYSYPHQNSSAREMTLKRTIELREHYNATLLLERTDPILVSMTETTALAILDYIKHLDQSEIDTQSFMKSFMNRLDEEFEKILHPTTEPNKPDSVPSNPVKMTKDAIKAKIDEALKNKLKKDRQTSDETPWYR